MTISLPDNTRGRHLPALRTAWGFLQHELIFICWSLMEVSLLTPVVLAALNWASYWPPTQVALWLLSIMLLSFNLVRLMSILWMPPATQRNVISLALLLMLLIAVPTMLYRPESLLDLSWLTRFYENVAESDDAFWRRDLSTMLLIIFMWWRGIRLAHQGFGVQRAGLRLRIGSLIIAPLVVWSDSQVAWSATPFLLLFFLAALLSVALVRAEEIEREHSGSSVSLKPSWLAVVFTASLLIVFSAGTAAAIISGDTALIIASWLSPLWLALSVGLATIASTLGYLAQPLFVLLNLLIDWLSAQLRGIFNAAFEAGLELPQIELTTPEATAEFVEDTVSSTSFDGGRMIALLLLVALVLLVALSLVRLYQYSTLSAAGSGSWLPSGRQSRAGRSGMVRQLMDRLGGWRRWRAAASIRRVYRDMCRAAEASGYPRAMSETPYEYQKTLDNVWPEHKLDAYLITQAYVRVRYGELPETKAELDEILAAWQRLERSQPASMPEPPAE